MEYYCDVITEFFDIGRGGRGITEELIYNNKGNLPVISATSEDFQIFGEINRDLFKNKILNDIILVVRVGKAGKCQYVENECLVTENVLTLRLKDKYIGKVEPEWFSKYVNNILLNNATGERTGQRSISNEIIARIKIKIPKDIKLQENFVKKSHLLKSRLRDLININDKIINLMNKEILIESDFEIKCVSDVFDVTSGVRVTEEEAYNNAGNIPIITSQTTNNGITWYGSENWLRNFSKNNQLVIIDKECISWAKDGCAGKLFLRNMKFYPNDHCGVLLVNEDYVTKIILKWFYYTKQQYFYKYVYGKSGQGMLYEESVKRIKFRLPKDITYQERISKKYDKLEILHNRIDTYIKSINRLLEKVILN